jgi:hypothetical protein
MREEALLGLRALVLFVQGPRDLAGRAGQSRHAAPDRDLDDALGPGRPDALASCWLAIGPFSAWIRRMFLRAARARAEGSGAGRPH